MAWATSVHDELPDELPGRRGHHVCLSQIATNTARTNGFDTNLEASAAADRLQHSRAVWPTPIWDSRPIQPTRPTIAAYASNTLAGPINGSLQGLRAERLHGRPRP
jgi:hypothetical protein